MNKAECVREMIEETQAEIVRAQRLLIGKTIVSAVADFDPSVAWPRNDHGSWTLTFSDGSSVEISASYDDSGIHFKSL